MVLTACDFKPLYGGISSHKGKGLGAIKINVVSEREGQILRNKLLHLLTPSGHPRYPKYELRISMQYQDRDLGIARDATTTLSQIVINVGYQLVDFRSGKVLYRDTIKTAGDYNVLKSSYYSNVVSEKSAREGMLEEVAESIKVSIASYLDYQETSYEDSASTVQ